jgi:hypothetical protein
MTNLRTGLASQLSSPVAEVTYGVAPSLSAAKFSAFTAETLELKKTPVQGKGLLQNKEYGVTTRRVITNWEAGGTITMDLPAQHLQQWLFPMFGSYGQTPATLTQDGTTGAFKAIHAPGPLEGNSFCIQKGVSTVDNGTIEPFTYVGCKVSDWTVSVQTGQIATLELTNDARNELGGTGNSDPLNGSVPSLATYSQPPGGVFHFAQATLFTGGTLSTTAGVTTVTSPVVAGNVKTAQVKQTVPLDTTRFNLGLAGFKAEQLQNDLRTAGGQFTVEWLSSEARYDAFASDTPTALELQFLGPAIGTGSDFSTFTLLLSNVYLEGESPKVGGPEVVVETIPFSALDDGTNNVIQATYWTLDTT